MTNEMIERWAMKLAVGNTSQTVEVQASAVQVDTSNIQLSNIVDASQIVDLPLLGRNFTQLELLVPGVQASSDRFGTFSANGAQSQAVQLGKLRAGMASLNRLNDTFAQIIGVALPFMTAPLTPVRFGAPWESPSRFNLPGKCSSSPVDLPGLDLEVLLDLPQPIARPILDYVTVVQKPIQGCCGEAPHHQLT